MMVPLYQQETSALIGKTFMERWVSWAGMPKEIVCDPAPPDVVDGLTVPLELQGAAGTNHSGGCSLATWKSRSTWWLVRSYFREDHSREGSSKPRCVDRLC